MCSADRVEARFFCTDTGAGVPASGVAATVDGQPIGAGDPLELTVGGEYTISLECTDGAGRTAQTSNTFYVLDAVDDAVQVNEDSSVDIDVAANDLGMPDATTVILVGDDPATPGIEPGAQPTNGTVAYDTDNTLIYTPDADYSGPDAFMYTICGAINATACDTATVNITVNPVNDAILRWVGSTLAQHGATVPLRVTATSDEGDVVGATVTFVVKDETDTVVATYTDDLVELYPGAGDDVGTAFAMHTFSVPGSVTGPTVFTVEATVSGTNTAGESVTGTLVLDPQPVTIFKNVQHSITGGGNLVLANSAGEFPANVGSKKNYGFNADTGKKGNRPKGDVNIVYEFENPDLTLTDYQLKAPDINSVGFIGAYGEITGTDDLTDLGTGLIVASGLILQVMLIDGDDATPSGPDLVAYTAWDPVTGHLVFATNWDVALARPVMQGLDGGNIDIK